MKAALYARTSTRDQQSIPQQIDAMRQYAAGRGWEIVEEVTEQESGANNQRSGRARILSLARRRKIDVVCVWKLNRWGRSTVDLLLTLDELAADRVSFVSISEQLDFSTPIGRMNAGLLAVFAQFEREMIAENVRAGIAAYRRKGNAWGRPAIAPAQKEKALALKGQGVSVAEIAKELKISRASVYRLL